MAREERFEDGDAGADDAEGELDLRPDGDGGPVPGHVAVAGLVEELGDGDEAADADDAGAVVFCGLVVGALGTGYFDDDRWVYGKRRMMTNAEPKKKTVATCALRFGPRLSDQISGMGRLRMRRSSRWVRQSSQYGG